MLSSRNTELQFESKETSSMDNEMRWACGISMGNFRILTKFFLISNFYRVLNVVRFLLGNSLASEFYTPTFRNTVCSIFIGGSAWRILRTYPPMKIEQTECSETSAYKIQTPGN